MLNKIMSVKEAANKIKDGSSIILSGFFAIGCPDDIVAEIAAQGKKDLTIIANDGGTPLQGGGRLLYSENVSIKKYITSWVGFTPIFGKLVIEKGMEYEYNPQGTIAERIRAGGSGLGGVLTKAGLGTDIETNGWGERVTFNGEDWLYHKPIRADVALIEAWQADEAGNCVFNKIQLTNAEIASMAADLVIVSVVKPIVKVGELDPNLIRVPAPLVDILVQQEEEYTKQIKYITPEVLAAVQKSAMEDKLGV